MGKKQQKQKKVEPLPKLDPALQKELEEPLDVENMKEQIAKFPRAEKQRLEMLVEGLFLFAPDDFLNGVEGEESDSEVTARHLEEKYKPKKTISAKNSKLEELREVVIDKQLINDKKHKVVVNEREPIIQVIEQKQPATQEQPEEQQQGPQKQQPKFAPKFHLEPVPAEFLPKNADPEKLSPEEFKDRFQRMREYMTARRKAINQDEKRKRREERVSKKKTKPANNNNAIDAKVQKKKSAVGPLIMTKIVKEEKEKKAGPTPKQALEKLNQEQEKLDALKKRDPKAAQELVKKSTLKRAFAKARGESVKDDPRKLKRTIQRTEKEKKKSEITWRETKSKVKYGQKTRVEKREKNIKERVEKIKEKKQKQRKRR